MGTIISICNQKGGTGKSTTAVNLAAGLALAGENVVLIDMDPQAHASAHVGVHDPDVTVEDVMASRAQANEACFETPVDELVVIPSSSSLSVYEANMVQEVGKEHILKEALEVIAPHVGFIVLDCPPSLDMLTINALSASHYCYIPTQAEFFALDGVAKLRNTIATINKRINPHLVIGGIILTMYSERMNHHHRAMELLSESFPDSVLETKIRRNVRLADAASHGQPIQLYDEKSNGAKDYTQLAKEVCERCLSAKTR